MRRRCASGSSARLVGALVFAAAILLASTAGAQVPTFSKAFAPSAIGPGSVSTLTFTITNVSASPVTDLAFTDVLPAAVTIAAAAQGTTTCTDGLVSALNGGTTIGLTDGRLGPGASCTVTVNVTTATVGAHVNLSGDLTSSAGNSGTATDTLTVDTDRPGFLKSFAQNPIALGARGTLTFTIDNSLIESFADSLVFTDSFPAGLVIADPANVTNNCVTESFTGGVITAIPGTSVVSLASGTGSNIAFVEGNSTCTITVDVVATAVGLLGNVTGDLTSSLGNSGKAAATLEVTAADIVLIKAFTGDPIPPGGTVNLQFTILNLSRTDEATNLAFQDNLNAVLSGLAATGPPTPNPPCGAGSSLTGTSSLTFSGGSVPPEGSCTFSVPVLVPAAAETGDYPNTTTALTGVVGAPVVGNQAFDVLFVSVAPTISKSFLVDPVAAGGSTTLQFTITNTSDTFVATDIAFIDELTTFLPFPLSVSLPPVPDPPCGPGSTLTVISLGLPTENRQGLSLTDGFLNEGESCVFTVGINIPAGLPGNVYVNTTNPITANVAEEPVTGGVATDTLTVVGAPRLVKEFTNDPVAPGGTVSLRFTLTHDALAGGNAVGVTFTDNLAATLTGLTATGLPLINLCGPGNGTLTGSAGNTLLTFSGATLTPGQTCVFSVTLQVAPAAVSGVHPNTTSSVNATVSGLAVVGSPAQDNLVVSALRFTKRFLNHPVLPGGTAILELVLDNALGSVGATSIAFTDNLDDALPGLTALSPPPSVCGGSLSGSSLLVFNGGSVAAGETCAFSVTVQVPAGAADGDHINTTSSLSASIPPAGPVVLPPATAVLTVASDLLVLTKAFSEDAVAPGETVTLEFDLTNLSAQTITSITFTDNLGAALSGLQATGLPVPACNGTLSGTSTLSLNNASLTAGASCQFSVTLSVPLGVPPGTVVTNVTSSVTGLIGAVTVTGGPASDDLVIEVLEFEKSFAGPAVVGTSVQLTFTIRNLHPDSPVTGITFTDNLGAVLAGLSAVGLPATNVCGPGSQLTGTSTIALSQGSLGPGATCTFSVTVQVPAGTAPGTYPNTTSDLFLAGLKASNPASASLIVNAVPVPTFAKVFAPSPIVAGGVSTLTFTIDNSASPLPVTDLTFTDNLPAGVAVASPANVANTCVGGIVTAVAGTEVIAYDGGSVAADVTCTVRADVTSLTTGTHANTSGNLTSSAGNSGPASASLIVNAGPVPTFTKSFSPATISAGGVSTLTFTIGNVGSLLAAANLTFTDNLPSGVAVASPSNAASTCVGGTLTAVSGSGVIAYSGGSVAAGATCTVRADVTSLTTGTHANTSGNLTSSAGNSGPASASLIVNAGPIPPTFTKAFSPTTITSGGVTTLTFTIDNSANLVPATNLAFTDNLPAGVVVATPAIASNSCIGGTLTAVAGTSVISYSGGSVAAGVSCAIQVDVTVTGSGTFVNTAQALTSSLGDSGTAGATLIVGEDARPIPTLGELGLLLLGALLALVALRRLRPGVPTRSG